MDFIINNYIWIIVISIILVMALIGYLAEKTDFIHENKQKKKEYKKAVKEEKEEEVVVESPKSEIPVTPLVSPVAEVNSTADSLGFEDPFAMTKDTVSAEKIEEQQVENESNTKMNSESTPNALEDEKVDESLFAPVEKPKFGEPFSVPEDYVNHEEPKETQNNGDSQLETLEPLENLNDKVDSTEEVKSENEKTDVSPVVEEINDSDIYGTSNATKEIATIPEEDQIAAPKLEEETTDEMDEWKI